MSLKLVKLGKFLNENEDVRYQVSFAYEKGIINGEPDIEVIANNLYQLSKTVNFELDFTYEEILEYLPRYISKSERIAGLDMEKSSIQQETMGGRYNYISLHNIGGFVCDMVLYTENVLQSEFYHSNNIPAGQTERKCLTWFEASGELEDGALFQMMPYVYLAADGTPISQQLTYDRNANKCANFEISGTTCNIILKYTGDTEM